MVHPPFEMVNEVLPPSAVPEAPVTPTDNRTRTSGSSGQEEAMMTVPLSAVKDDLSKYLRLAENEEVIITR